LLLCYFSILASFGAWVASVMATGSLADGRK
jgi:hypothetical protein